MNESIYDELKWREMIHDQIDGVEKLLSEKKVTLYNGFDPTAGSVIHQDVQLNAICFPAKRCCIMWSASKSSWLISLILT